MSKSSETAMRVNATTGPWIYAPWLDLIVGCGAWSAPLLLISYLSMASSTRAWSVAFYALALFFNYPHYMATLYRAYHREEDFHKYRLFTVHITALVVLTLLASHVWLRALPWIFTLYLTWSPWHYSGQNYGLFMMFARRAGAQPSTRERRALYGAFVVSYLILFLGFHTGPSTDPLFISLGIPAVVSRWEQVGLGVLFVALSAYGLRSLIRVTGWRKLTPSLTLFSTQFLWFLVPALASLIKGLEIPQSRYSSGVLAVMHSAQYLWITSYYARRESSDSNRDGHGWHPFAYFSILVAGGIALFVPGPWLASRILHYDFTASFLIFTALVNIHHFILDGAIWKLRDGRIAILLLNSKVQVRDAVSEAGGQLASAWHWLTGSTGGARALRVAAALVLLASGTIDQARYYLALHNDNLHDLQKAASLDSYDGSLQMRLAQSELENGRPQEAESAWRSAMRTNPNDPAPRHAMLRYLIEQKRFDEAYALTQISPQSSPKDANMLVDRGILALQLGHQEEAVARWKQALAADSTQGNANLYLADELDREGKTTEAISYYRTFLETVARQGRENRPEPRITIAIVLRMADCQVRAAQPEQAAASYHLAAGLAAQTKESKLESVAAISEAVLQAKAGNVDDALQLYQRALLLDEALGDQGASAQDWFSYGHFLERGGFPTRLVYASYLKAQSLAQSPPIKAILPSLSDDLKQTAKLLGPEAAKLRRDPQPACKEALWLRR